MDLRQRVALVTGGKRVGQAVAVALAGRGMDVALAFSRSRDEAERTAALVRDAGRRAEIFQADLADPGACTGLVHSVASTFGRLDVLVNMASVYAHRDFDALTVADWDAVLAVDLRAAFLCAHAAAPYMRLQGGGRIVNFSDWVARSGRPRYQGFVPYYVAKAGIVALTEALALELAADGILVNAIAPGPILAPPDTTDEEARAVARVTPLGRWGGEAAIAHAVLTLLDSDFVTGETLRVDGGRHLK